MISKRLLTVFVVGWFTLWAWTEFSEYLNDMPLSTPTYRRSVPVIELLVGPITSLLEKVVPDLDERKRMAHDIATLAERQAHEQIMAQVDVNKQEAAHKSLFVAGWRPATGWICASAMAFNFIVVPLLGPVVTAYTEQTLTPLELSVMLPVLLGMLGLGGMRSYEKRNGVAREK